MARGRPSAERQAAVLAALPIIPGERPEPPPDLDAEAAAVWRATVAAVPAGWLPPECFPVLTQFCRHTVHCDWLTEEIAELRAAPLDEESQKRLYKLLRLHGQQSQILASLAGKLRLTPSSRATPDKARDDRKDASSSATPKPWNDWTDTPRQ
jgi:hypothetical protein